MTLQDIRQFVVALQNVQQEENFGYTFFFVGDDHRLPFVSYSEADNEYDHVSDLDREGVFRVNIGVRRETFDALFPDGTAGDVDYTTLNVFLPHPEYARQHFICILNPAGENAELTRTYIIEAHGLAAGRLRSRAGSGWADSL